MPDELDGILLCNCCGITEIQTHATETESGDFETVFSKCTFLHRYSLLCY